MFKMPGIEKIEEIGQHLAVGIEFFKNALAAIARNQRDLYAEMQVLKRNQVLIMQHLGLLGKEADNAGISNGKRDRNGDEIQPGDGRELGNHHGDAD